MNPTDPFGLAGQVLDGQFRVERLVGEGGFSAVYRGHNLGLNEPVAIKCLKLPPGVTSQLIDTFIRRFQDESRILYRLSQGNLFIVRSISAGTTQSPSTGMLLPYMILEWLEGRSVANDFTVRKTLGLKGRSIDEIISLFGTAADALGYAHSQGVIHRDLNPGNLFFAQTPQGVRMKVLDFGVAKLMDDSTLGMGARTQTIGQFRVFAPAYGAPEQFDDNVGPVGPWSDVYSFALILLEAMRDRVVHEGTNLGDFMHAALDPNRRPTPRSLGIEAGPDLEDVFVRATALDPRSRIQNASELWTALSATMRKPATPAAPKAMPKSDPLLRTVPFGSQAMPHKPGGLANKVGRSTVVGIAPPAQPPRGGSSPAIAAVRPPSTPPRPPRPPRPPTPPRPPSNPPRPNETPTDPPVTTVLASDPPTMAVPSSTLASSATAIPQEPGRGHDEEEDSEEEVTRVRAPEPDMLRTLSMQEMRQAMAKPGAQAAQHPPAPRPNATMAMSQAPVERPNVSPAATIAFNQPPPQPAKPPSAPPPQGPDPLRTQPQPRFQTPPPPQASPAEPPLSGTLMMAMPQEPQSAAPHTPIMAHHTPMGAFSPQPPQAAPSYPQQNMQNMQNAPMHSASMTSPRQSQGGPNPAPFPPPPSYAQAQAPEPAKANKTVIVVVSVLAGIFLVSGLTLMILALRARSAMPGATMDAGAVASSVASNTTPPPSATPAETVVVAPPPVEDAGPTEVEEPVDAGMEAASPATPASGGPAFTWPPPSAAPVASAKPDEPGWNPNTARQKLQTMNGVLIICKKENGLSGPGGATVVFQPDGTVSSVTLDPPYAGTKEGECAAGQFRRAKVNAFPGVAQSVRHSFDIPK